MTEDQSAAIERVREAFEQVYLFKHAALQGCRTRDEEMCAHWFEQLSQSVEELALADSRPVGEPEALRATLDALGYHRLFWAISAAVNIPYQGAVGISVEAFIKTLTGVDRDEAGVARLPVD